MPSHYLNNRQDQILNGFSQGQQPQIPEINPQPNQGNQIMGPSMQNTPPGDNTPQQPAGPDDGFDQYLSEQLSSIRRSMNTVKTKTFAATTRLDAMNRFIRDFGEIFGGDSEPISMDVFTQNEKTIMDAADKIVGQLEMLSQGKLSNEEFFNTAQDVFDDMGGQGETKGEFQLGSEKSQKPPQSGDQQGQPVVPPQQQVPQPTTQGQTITDFSNLWNQ